MYAQAVQDATKAIQLRPDFAFAYYHRSLAYFHQQDYDQTITDTTQVIQLDPNNAEAYGIRGLAYARKGKYEQAINNFNKTIEQNPKLDNTYYFRGLARLALERWQEAKSDLITAKEMGRDIVSSFRREYNSVAAFEKKTDIRVPEEIAAMLTKSGK